MLRPRGLLVGSVPNCYRLKTRLRFLLGRPPENDPTTPTPNGTRRRLTTLLAGWSEIRSAASPAVSSVSTPALFANDNRLPSTEPTGGPASSVAGPALKVAP